MLFPQTSQQIGGQTMKVLHISYDFPDPINSNKTKVIQRLIEASPPEISNDCISLNRVNKKQKEEVITSGNVTALAVYGLPLGLNFRSLIRRATSQIEQLKIALSDYDVFYAHKLSFEGPIAMALSEKYNRPFILDIMQTDCKVLKFRPDLKPLYRKMLTRCVGITFSTYWVETWLKEKFGSDFYHHTLKEKMKLLPYIANVNHSLLHQEHNNKYVCAVDLKKANYRIKNMERLLRSVAILKKKGRFIRLDIYGYGIEMPKVEEAVKRLNLQDRVRVLGRVNNEEIQQVFSGYKAFILASWPESFGVVFIEALRAGIPIIYSDHMAIDGFFNDYMCQVKVKYNSVESLADAFIEIEQRYDEYKYGVEQLQQSGKLEQFTKCCVGETYGELLRDLLH